MKYPVRRFKSLKICLKELERFIRNGERLQTGKRFKNFDGGLPREILANWLLCVTVNFTTEPDRLTFTSDPTGGDGIIVDTKTNETWPTEHVMVPGARDGAAVEDGEALILKAIEGKQKKGGAAYASGKTLVVFSNAGGGAWRPNNVARQLPKPLDFEAVWVVALQGVEGGEYVHGVTRLDLSRGSAPVWRVRIASDFSRWKVEEF